MNKKFLGALAALALVAVSGVFAASGRIGNSGKFGIGVQGGFNPIVLNGGAAITFKIPNVPPVFAVDVGISSNGISSVGATADWWIANPNITGPLNWFYGPGLALGGSWWNDGAVFYAGARLVAGLQVWVVDFAEIYLQAAAQIGIEAGSNFGLHLAIPLNVGLRFWF